MAGAKQKVVVFAHVPPPHHGQSQMVQYLVEGCRAAPDLGVEVLHVDARLSENLTDVGAARGRKIARLFGYVRQARALGRQHGTRTLYYVPSPPVRNSLLRDWIALSLLRPYFRKLIFHWHAVGLGQWLEDSANAVERAVSHRLLGRATLSIVLSQANQADAETFRPLKVALVPNGIPDPCPDFDGGLAEYRRQRQAARIQAGSEVKVLFLAAVCSRDKGVLDAIAAVRQANILGATLPHPLRFQLQVAGQFTSPEDEAAFKALLRQPDVAGCVRHTGFLGAQAKVQALRECDMFLFPSYFANEGQPLSLIEAMAFGLPIVSTRWRGIPEMLSPEYAGLVQPRDPRACAEALLQVARTYDGSGFRELFLRKFQLSTHLRTLAEALRQVGPAD